MKASIKIVSMLAILIALLVSTVSGSVLAGSTTKLLSTNYTLVNLGDADAQVSVNYMKDDGSSWAADSANTDFTVPKNYGTVQIRQYFDKTLSAGKGSVVISSSAPLGAVVQIKALNQTPSQGAYSGFNGGSNKFYVPLAARQATTASGTANSQIVIQNTDSTTFAVTVDLYKGATKSYSKSISSLAPGQSFYYDLADESNLSTNWVGSAVVTAAGTGKIAVVSNFFTGKDAMQTFNAFASDTIGPKWVAPLFFSRLTNGLSTVIAVQNLSGAKVLAGDISLNCSADKKSSPASFSVKNPADIAPNASYSFNPATDKTLFPNANWSGSCQLDAGSANVVAIVQMRYVGVTSVNAAAYEAIPATNPTGKTLVAPLVAKRLSNGFASVVAIQNMDNTQAASVTLVYTPSFIASECPISICDINKDGKVDANDKITVGPLSIPAGASIQRNHRINTAGDPDNEPKLPSGWQGSLVVTSSTTPINGFIQLTNTITKTGDTFMAHNAFILP